MPVVFVVPLKGFAFEAVMLALLNLSRILSCRLSSCDVSPNVFINSDI